MKEERPEKVPDLKLLVEKKFLALQDKNSDADFRDNEKFAQYKQQLRELKKQCKSATLLWFLDVRDLTREQFRTTGLLAFSPLLASSSECLVLLQFCVCLIVAPAACPSLKAYSFHKVSHCRGGELGKQNKMGNHFIQMMMVILSKYELPCQALEHVCSCLLLWSSVGEGPSVFFSNTVQVPLTLCPGYC